MHASENVHCIIYEMSAARHIYLSKASNFFYTEIVQCRQSFQNIVESPLCQPKNQAKAAFKKRKKKMMVLGEGFIHKTTRKYKRSGKKKRF